MAWQQERKNVVNRDSTVVLGQKSTLELFQQHIEQELSTDPLTEPVDRKIAITEKLAESVGLALNVQPVSYTHLTLPTIYSV